MANITLSIPDDKVTEYTTAILKAQPKDRAFVGNDAAWVKQLLITHLRQLVQVGKERAALEALSSGPDDIG